MWKWKAFDPQSWAALLSSLARLKGAADENKSAVSGLGEDFARLSELTAKDIAGKQDKPKGTSCTIPATGWEKDETENYTNYYDMPVTLRAASVPSAAIAAEYWIEQGKEENQWHLEM